VSIGGQVIMRTSGSSFIACNALLADSKVQGCLFFIENLEFLGTGFPVDLIDSLILLSESAEGCQNKHWKAWLDFADISMQMCKGDIICYRDYSEWMAFSNKNLNKKITPLGRDEIKTKIRKFFESNH
jgi:hypothetical protein